MAQRYALLLDGGFLRHKLSMRPPRYCARGISAFAAEVSRLPCLAYMRLHRIYYYDSQPLQGFEQKPLGGGTLDLGSSFTAARNKELQSDLCKEPFFALRFGELLFEGWRLKAGVLGRAATKLEIGPEDLEPNIRQKGVDMRIGIDIASLTLKKHVDTIVLVTGDSDFIPAMKFARREGAQLILVTLGHGIREGLREHADLVVDQFPLPQPRDC